MIDGHGQFQSNRRAMGANNATAENLIKKNGTTPFDSYCYFLSGNQGSQRLVMGSRLYL